MLKALKRTIGIGLVSGAISVAGMASSEEVTRSTLSAGSLGAGWYVMGTAMAKEWADEMDDLEVTVTTGGSIININKVAAGGTNLGFTLNPALHDAMDGKGQFEGKADEYQSVRTVFSWPGSVIQLVVLGDSGIESIADLEGKRIAVDAKGGSMINITSAILEEHGVTKDNSDFRFVSARDAADQLRNGHIDAAFWGSAPPYAVVSDIALYKDIRMLEVQDEETAKRITDRLPGAAVVAIDQDVYGENQLNSDPVEAIGFNMSIIAHEEFDEELMYEAVKALFSNLDEFASVSAMTARVTPEGAVFNNAAPLHPGAARYFKEVGVLK